MTTDEPVSLSVLFSTFLIWLWVGWKGNHHLRKWIDMNGCARYKMGANAGNTMHVVFVTDAQVRFFISSCMLTNHCCCIVEAGAPRDFLLEAWNETGYNRTCVLRKAAGQYICWPTEGCTAAETATGWERAFFFITCTQKRDNLPHLLEEFKIHFRMYAV